MAITKKVNKDTSKFEQENSIGIENADGVVVAWVNCAVNRKVQEAVLAEDVLIKALESKGLQLRVTSNTEVEMKDVSASL